MSWRQTLERQWYEGGAWADCLRPLGALYCVAAAWRRRHTPRFPGVLPSIVVGNLTVGGSAKTPTSMALLRYLQQRSWQPAAISRGYGARPPGREPYAVALEDSPDRAGDEPLLLRGVAPVYLSHKRRAGIAAAAAAGHDIVVLDDGFQHLDLLPSLSLLLVHGERPFGNGRCLPAGPLREDKAALQLADALLCDAAALHSPLLVELQRPKFLLQTEITGLVTLAAAPLQIPLECLRGTRLHAVTGIARPQRFQHSLEALGAEVILHTFPDHHVFRQQDLADLPGPLVMTSKDAVKCRHLAGLPEIWVLEIGIRWESAFETWLDGQLADWRNPA